MVKKILIMVALITLIAFPARAQLIEDLQDILDLGSVTIGDKIFTNWDYSYQGSPGLPEITPSDIGVIILDEPLNPGFIFQSLWQVGPDQFQDSLIYYTVTSQGSPIKDISALMAGGYSGTGIATVDEVTSLGVGIHLENSASLVLLTDTKFFDPTMGPIEVIKDIGVAGGIDGTASISGVSNRFSQVPEPSTLLMLGSGLLGFALLRRKFR